MHVLTIVENKRKKYDAPHLMSSRRKDGLGKGIGGGDQWGGLKWRLAVVLACTERLVKIEEVGPKCVVVDICQGCN